MTDEEVNQLLMDNMMDDASFFVNPNFASAIIGRSEDGGVVYQYEKMIQSMAQDEGITEEEAMEWIDYNTIRSIPYMPEPRPVIVYGIEI